MNRPARKKKKNNLCCNDKIGFEIEEIWLVRVVPGWGGAAGHRLCSSPHPPAPGVQPQCHCCDHRKHTKCEILEGCLMFGFLELIHMLNNNLCSAATCMGSFPLREEKLQTLADSHAAAVQNPLLWGAELGFPSARTSNGAARDTHPSQGPSCWHRSCS